MSRRFLQCLKEGVESGARKHMGLVYDVNFELAGRRRRPYPVLQVPYLVYAPVRGGVYFNDVEGGLVFGFKALTAFVARFSDLSEFFVGSAFFAIQKFRD